MYELLSHSKKFTKNLNQNSMLSMSYLAISYVINFINHVIYFYESDVEKRSGKSLLIVSIIS